MSSAPPLTDSMRTQLSKFTTSLHTFATSPSTFRILHSLPTNNPLPPPKTLYILDSSFNPPTLAHLRIATSALLHDTQPSPSPKRLLLLLATKNADKAPQPAPFEHRLLMMQIFASDLLSSLHALPSPSSLNNSTTSSSEEDANEEIGIDIAVTKLPYFVDKAKAIDESGVYERGTQQVHLTGFDTLIRILDPKYYPQEEGLVSVERFLRRNRLRVTYRVGDGWGGREEQEGFLRELGMEGKEGKEGEREWVEEGRIVLVEGREEGEEVVSSTKVREAVKRGNGEALRRLVTPGVAEWVLEQGLYKDD